MAETIKIMQEEHCGHGLIERIVRPDGQLRYVRAVAVPVVEKGVFKGFVGTTMDITRSIVESYGGQVWATPNEGAGATFYFTLSCQAEAQA